MHVISINQIKISYMRVKHLTLNVTSLPYIFYLISILFYSFIHPPCICYTY